MKEETGLVPLREFIEKEAPDAFWLVDTSDSGKIFITVRTILEFLVWGGKDIARIHQGTEETLVEWFPGAKPKERKRLADILSTYRQYLEEYQAETTWKFLEKPVSLAEFFQRSMPKGLWVGVCYPDPLRRWPTTSWRNIFFSRGIFRDGSKVARVSVVDWDAEAELQVFAGSRDDSEYLLMKDLAQQYETYVMGLRGVRPKITLKLVYTVRR